MGKVTYAPYYTCPITHTLSHVLPHTLSYIFHDTYANLFLPSCHYFVCSLVTDGLDPTAAALLGGKPDQMLFLARNHQALTHKHSVNTADLGRTDGVGLEYQPGKDHQQLMTSAKALMALSLTGHSNDHSNNDHSNSNAPIPLASMPLAKDHVVLARRKKRPGSGLEP